MSEIQLGALEFEFAEIIWANEPVTSAQLCKLAAEALNWHKSTTYTVLRRICAKGIFRNDNSTVTSILKRDDYFTARSRCVVNEEFDGSLPAFIAAFAKNEKLTAEQAEALRVLIDKSECK
ncbi:MAG: BlaI/MecI/CopY family transcriptional regulator [Clostridia bacterium]|nr:BlaI/MecI/CopY family transcriptional regulator [Clostridia bacterium]